MQSKITIRFGFHLFRRKYLVQWHRSLQPWNRSNFYGIKFISWENPRIFMVLCIFLNSIDFVLFCSHLERFRQQCSKILKFSWMASFHSINHVWNHFQNTIYWNEVSFLTLVFFLLGCDFNAVKLNTIFFSINKNSQVKSCEAVDR